MYVPQEHWVVSEFCCITTQKTILFRKTEGSRLNDKNHSLNLIAFPLYLLFCVQ